MIGRTLGHYQILEQIGAGGMGVVYRARDQHLERDVVLKLIPAELLGSDRARQRFRHEALALSRLNHPNIATVHDFASQDGVDFLILEHIPGDTLDDRLRAGAMAEREVLQLGIQLAAGLEAAHRQGVIHRDLKPGNLRTTPDGLLKILDFGLARLLEPDPSRTKLPSLTEAHAIVGTLAYMAPEQFAEHKADARSDLHSVGAVLYEMISGRRAFPELTAPELMYAITHQMPRPPGSFGARVSPGLETVIFKALSKDPELRFQSARELRVDLERLANPARYGPDRARGGAIRPPLWAGIATTAAFAIALLWITNPAGFRDRLWPSQAAGPISSLAVLPLENLARDPDQEYFADGMTDELITCLGKISALRVIARGSVMEYKGTHRPMREIARALGVAALLEGSVLRANGRVRITARLMQAATGKLLWSESYERSLSDVLSLQSEVALAIASAIQVQLTPREHARFETPRPVDPRAHEAYLIAKFDINRSSHEEILKGIEGFKEAIRIDPGYAIAHAELAGAYLRASNWWMSPGEAIPLARAELKQALALDTDQPDALALVGYIEAVYDFDFAKADGDLRRATEQGGSSPLPHLYYGSYLAVMGRFDEARAEFATTQMLDPLDSYAKWLACWPDFNDKKYDRAILQLQALIGFDPTSADAYSLLGESYEQQGQYAEALLQLRKAESLGTHAWTLAAIGRVHAEMGHRDSALAVISELGRRSAAWSRGEQTEYITPYGEATVFAALGDRDKAFAWLGNALQQHCEDLILLKVDPRVDTLRADPRFARLMKRVGFTDA